MLPCVRCGAWCQKLMETPSMFSKTEKVTQDAPVQASAPRSSSKPSLVSTDLEVVGDLNSTGELHIEGRVKGDVHGQNVKVAQGAEIEGSIFAQSVEVSGRIKGQVEASKVCILKSAEMLGDVLHETLEIESGAQFQGACRRLEQGVRGQSTSKPAA